MNIIYQNSNGHITIEQTGKSQSYVVWLNNGCSAVRKATFGVNVTNALDRCKGQTQNFLKLSPPNPLTRERVERD